MESSQNFKVRLRKEYFQIQLKFEDGLDTNFWKLVLFLLWDYLQLNVNKRKEQAISTSNTIHTWLNSPSNQQILDSPQAMSTKISSTHDFHHVHKPHSTHDMVKKRDHTQSLRKHVPFAP